MQVKSGVILAVSLVLGLLAGDAFACTNNPYDHVRCARGVVLSGWNVSGNRCVLSSTIVNRPFTCAGCEIDSRNGYIRVLTPEGTFFTCSYGPGGFSACEAYCTNTSGGIDYDWYECFVRRGDGDQCDCTDACARNND